MKNVLFTVVLTIAGYCSYAQNVLNPTGNAGVGTANPFYKFEVHGDDGSLVAVFGNNNIVNNSGLHGSLFIKSNSSTGIASLQSGGGNSGLSFITNNSGSDYVRMLITSTGKVGIGTTTPASDLSIVSHGSGVSLNSGDGYLGTLAFNRESATGTIFNPAGNAFQINNGNGSDKNLHIQVYNGAGAMINSDALSINGTTSGVGINTASVPAGYQLAVNGSVIATSMTVKLYGNWPDFVFKKDYKLRSLSELKSYLDRYSHLPEMPSAQEIAEKGINLGEMNKILTKKVEELTLYLIKENQKNQDQQHKLEQQEIRLAALEAALLKLSGK